MLENPGHELYFGEVYRTILQEAWLPTGEQQWQRAGISRRGRRPTQQGPGAHSPNPSQFDIRLIFSQCVSAWNALPWELPDPDDCDNRNPKKYWKEEKDRRGVMCSYYDLFMRHCIAYRLATQCLPPSAYLLKVSPPLTRVKCNKVYDLTFSNQCGEISMVSGPGSFNPPSEWLSPPCGSEGHLCFTDANGSQGSTPFKFSSDHYCEDFWWSDKNPDDIDPGSSEEILVEGGVGPFFWTVTGDGFSLANPGPGARQNTLIAAYPCGPLASIHVEDACGNVTEGSVPSSLLGWCTCGGTATGGPNTPCGPGSFDIVSGIYRIQGLCDSQRGSTDVGCNALSSCGVGEDGVIFTADSICGGGSCALFKWATTYAWVG